MSTDIVKNMQQGASKAVPLLKVMAHEKRLTILCSLMDKEMAVGPLSEQVGIRQATLSQHLAALRHQGLVKTRRDAQTVYYRLDNENVARMIALLHELFCEQI